MLTLSGAVLATSQRGAVLAVDGQRCSRCVFLAAVIRLR